MKITQQYMHLKGLFRYSRGNTEKKLEEKIAEKCEA